MTTTVTPQTTTGRTRRASMGESMPPRLPKPYRSAPPSAAVQLAQALGVGVRSAEAMLGGERSVFKLAALAAAILRKNGETERLAEKLIELDMVLGPEADPSLTLPQALLDASLADADEECPDHTFQFNLARGTATVAMARAFLRKSACQRVRHELAERLTLPWIEEQEEAAHAAKGAQRS